ncbi:MAG: PilZ domain-containing protein [Novosphingobium sp.]
MTDNDHRQIERDSLFVMAALRVDGVGVDTRVKVRNLSAGGMMAEGDVRVQAGATVEVQIRNIGWVEGSVAWVQDNRFGIAFRDEIDPKVARAPLAVADPAPHFLRASALKGSGRMSLRKL